MFGLGKCFQSEISASNTWNFAPQKTHQAKFTAKQCDEPTIYSKLL